MKALKVAEFCRFCLTFCHKYCILIIVEVKKNTVSKESQNLKRWNKVSKKMSNKAQKTVEISQVLRIAENKSFSVFSMIYQYSHEIAINDAA